MIPSIAVSAPAAGSTYVPITISVTNGTIIDGNGAVTVVTGVAPLQTTVPALVHQGFDPRGHAARGPLDRNPDGAE